MATPNSPELNLDTELFSGKLPGKACTLWSQILCGFWDLNPDQDSIDIHDYSVFHQYFVTELDAWRCYSDNVSLRTYQDLIDLVKHLKANLSASRSSPEVLAFFRLRGYCPSQVSHDTESRSEAPALLKCENSIFLAVRLWLMVNVGHPDLRKTFPGKTQISWNQNDNLEELVAAQFPSLSEPLIKFQYPRDFNVYEIERITELAVVWTDHLADHLLLDSDLGTITLYHHVSVLRRFEHMEKQLFLFPEGLLSETIQTLALLMPEGNIDCKSWCDRQKKQNSNNLDAKSCNLTLNPVNGRKQESYKYWNERLSILYRSFNESQPSGIVQFWRNRRNKMQWYTFWIAVVVLILTIVFGLIQSITGIMQVNLAYHPVS